MTKKERLKICFIGGKQAGVTGILAALSTGAQVLSAVSYSEELTEILDFLCIPVCKTIKNAKFIKKLNEADLLLSVHGREIVKPYLLKLPRFGGVNVHPYLYKYKGANPIERALQDNEFKASVGAHVMSKVIDAGEVIVEEFVDVSGAQSIEEVYGRLYPYYCIVTLKALKIICDKHRKNG